MPRSLIMPLGAGSEPELIEIDDAKESVGEFENFGDVIELCIKSPSGQCQYKMEDNYSHCIHCGKESGLP